MFWYYKSTTTIVFDKLGIRPQFQSRFKNDSRMNGNEVNLIIQDVQLNDSGVYICEERSRDGYTSASANINVIGEQRPHCNTTVIIFYKQY